MGGAPPLGRPPERRPLLGGVHVRVPIWLGAPAFRLAARWRSHFTLSGFFQRYLSSVLPHMPTHTRPTTHAPPLHHRVVQAHRARRRHSASEASSHSPPAYGTGTGSGFRRGLGHCLGTQARHCPKGLQRVTAEMPRYTTHMVTTGSPRAWLDEWLALTSAGPGGPTTVDDEWHRPWRCGQHGWHRVVRLAWAAARDNTTPGEYTATSCMNTRQHLGAEWPRVSARSHPRTKEAPEGEVGIGPRGALHHDGSLHQKAYTLGTHSARCDPQGSFTSTSARGDVPPAAAPASVLRRRLWAKGYTRSAAHAPTPGLVTPEPAQRAGGRAVWIEARMWGGFGGSATRVDPIHPPAPSLVGQYWRFRLTSLRRRPKVPGKMGGLPFLQLRPPPTGIEMVFYR